MSEDAVSVVKLPEIHPPAVLFGARLPDEAMPLGVGGRAPG